MRAVGHGQRRLAVLPGGHQRVTIRLSNSTFAPPPSKVFTAIASVPRLMVASLIAPTTTPLTDRLIAGPMVWTVRRLVPLVIDGCAVQSISGVASASPAWP